MYESKKKFPEIMVEKRNTDYAKLLLNDFAGEISEDSAIHQYFYQSLVVEDKDLAKDLMRISEVEMHHLDILGKIIYLLGVKPIFGALSEKKFVPWNSKFVDYTTKTREILIQNIRQERQAIINYQNHIARIQDEHIKEILNRIIEDEFIHIKIFYSYLQKLK